MPGTDRKKKDHQRTDKKRRRMRAVVAERQRNAAPERPSTDEVDGVTYKKGSGGDRQQQPQMRHQTRGG